MVRDEAEDFIRSRGKFRLEATIAGLVALTPIAPFSLTDIYTLRCFGTVGFVPGGADSIDALASIIASPLSRRVLHTFTEGTIRYRLNFAGKGHQRGAVRLLAEQVYALCPEILNDARNVTWTLDVYAAKRGFSVELRPNLTPIRALIIGGATSPLPRIRNWPPAWRDSRGRVESEIVWDPFCGSGSELIERALLGNVGAIHGTDLSAEAVAISRDNFAAAGTPVPAYFVRQDFRDYASGVLGPNSMTLVITNPPLGMRVPIADLHGLLNDLFNVAAKVLRPGGRLVLANPITLKKTPPSLQLQSRQAVDFGGFDCRVEKYIKL